MIHPTLQTQSPDAKEPTNILDTEQWSHRAVGREQEEKTKMQQWDHSVTHHRHTLMMSEHPLQNVPGWSRKKKLFYIAVVIFKHILRLSLVVWARSIDTSLAASPEQWAAAGLQQCPQSVWDRLGTAGAVLIISMAAEHSPALQESSAAAFTLPPLFCKRVYISFEEAMGAHKLDWLLPATVSSPFFCIHLLLSYLSVATHKNNTAD